MEQPQEVTIQPVKIPGSDDSTTRVWQTSSTSDSGEQQFLNQPQSPSSNAPGEVVAAAENVVSSSSTTKSDSTSASKPRRARKKKSQTINDFVIQYDGRFIGTYSPDQKLTSKAAFRAIAQELESQIGAGFDPLKLELFRPVPLKFDKPIESNANGTFRWFE